MKKIFFSFAAGLTIAGFFSCNNNKTSESSTTDTSRTTMNTDTSMNTVAPPPAPATPTVTSPLSKADSTFVMEAAIGGMMEVEAGKLAQQNAVNDRVKNFGAMMVRDHSKANSELTNLVAGSNITIPATLPADKQKHLDAMAKMTGKAFDNHYVNMMVSDHAKDIAEFKKQSTGAKDAQLKNWAINTLPTLQVHKDSIDAIKKMKM